MSAVHPDPALLAGRLRLTPGPLRPEQPTIVSSRPDLVPRLSVGRRAAELPALLGSLYTLCGHAHRWTAARAVAAAQGLGHRHAEAADIEQHRLATLREQILRISHDWPRLLPDAPLLGDAALLLRACPLWRDELDSADRLELLPAWLAQKWLGRSVTDWLHAFEAAPDTWPARWAAQTDTPVARLLRSQHAALADLVTPALALDVLSQPALMLPMLAHQMRRPGFCLQPDWQGEVPDTGPWSRHADPLRSPARSAWTRLVARLVEVLRLAAPDGAGWLGHGALALGPRDGLAWTEMARGLLLHRVSLAAEGDLVIACQVLAPTEWNFHPGGVLARALRELACDAGTAAATHRLALAFDPCVAFDVTSDITRNSHA